jgi:hypothetical protein
MTATTFPALSLSRLNWRTTWALFLVAFLLRFGVGVGIPSLMPHSNDSEAYRDLARNLVQRHVYATVVDPPHSLDVPYVTRPPLVPLSLALAYCVLGMNRISELLLLAAVGSFACVAIYWLGRELFDHRVACVAALFGAFYPFFLVLSIVPLTESWNVLLYPLLALFLVRYVRRRQLRDAGLAGIILGLSALCKPVVLTLFPFLPLLSLIGLPRNGRSTIDEPILECGGSTPLSSLSGHTSGAEPGAVLYHGPGATGLPPEFLRDHREKRNRATALQTGFAVMGLVAALVIAPWTARNYRATGHFVPVSLQFGAALFLGTSPAAEYSIDRLERGLTNGWDNPPDFARLYPQGTDPIAVDREAARQAAAYIRQDPGQFARLAWRKMRVFWGSYTHPAARLSWVALAALAVWGVYLSRSTWRELMPLYLLIANSMLIPIFFTSMPRFRAPIEPLLMLFAGRTLVWMAELVAAAGRRPEQLIEGRTPAAPV